MSKKRYIKRIVCSITRKLSDGNYGTLGVEWTEELMLSEEDQDNIKEVRNALQSRVIKEAYKCLQSQQDVDKKLIKPKKG